METQTTEAEIVDDSGRRDRRGRVSWPRERRKQLLAEYERSGLSQAAFARREGVGYSTFAHWVQARRHAEAAASTPGCAVPRFVEVGVPVVPSPPVVSSPAVPSELSVTLPDGVVVRGVDPRGLARLRVALKLIGRLYRLEREWDEADAKAERPRDPSARARLRGIHFTRSLRWLHALALALRSRHRPKSGLGLAAAYLLSQWTALTLHVAHGQTRLDNNLVENAVRPTAIGKKNWLFVGHPDAGQRSAILYSIIVSCLRRGVEPLAYLRDLLTRLPSMTNQDDLGPLLPSRWKPRS